MALVERAGRVLLVRVPEDELMGGLYELPHSGIPAKTGVTDSLGARYSGILRITPPAIASLRHSVTRYRIEAKVYGAKLTAKAPPRGAAFHTYADAFRLPLGGLTRKALRALGRAGEDSEALRPAGQKKSRF
jgi:adenine-specific DNA glycosylase